MSYQLLFFIFDSMGFLDIRSIALEYCKKIDSTGSYVEVQTEDEAEEVVEKFLQAVNGARRWQAIYDNWVSVSFIIVLFCCFIFYFCFG